MVASGSAVTITNGSSVDHNAAATASGGMYLFPGSTLVVSGGSSVDYNTAQTVRAPPPPPTPARARQPPALAFPIAQAWPRHVRPRAASRTREPEPGVQHDRVPPRGGLRVAVF